MDLAGLAIHVVHQQVLAKGVGGGEIGFAAAMARVGRGVPRASRERSRACSMGPNVFPVFFRRFLLRVIGVVSVLAPIWAPAS